VTLCGNQPSRSLVKFKINEKQKFGYLLLLREIPNKPTVALHSLSSPLVSVGIDDIYICSIYRVLLVDNQPDAQFLLWYVYFNPLHVSSSSVLILRRTIVL